MKKNSKKSEAERNREDKRRRRAWAAAQLIVGPWIRWKFNYSMADFDPADIDGPVLVAINHSCAYDPIFVGAVFRNKMLTFIASEHILRIKPWGPILDRYGSIIPHQKGAKGSRTALVAMKRIKRGESIFLAVEGEQTWNGRSLPVMPYTGKLAKGSGATLVTYKIEGGYLSAPRWALNTRRGKVYGYPVNIYSPETLKGMSDEEIEDAIRNDLWLDTYEWQRSQTGGPVSFIPSKGGSADGLERSVFTCPSCGIFGALKTEGNSIGCDCGFKIRLGYTGFFEQPAPFETVTGWEELDRTALKSRLDKIDSGEYNLEAEKSEDLTIFKDEDITLTKIGEGHNEEWFERGQLSLKYKIRDRDGVYTLIAAGHEFNVDSISAMTMVLAGRIVFGDQSGYYEIKAGKGTKINLRKYVIARELIKE